MNLDLWQGPAALDWIIIVAYLIFSIAVGLYFTARARRSTKDYFISGGGMPWWVLGTSMVATTFAADTPLALSGWVVTKGISQNWFWWCQVPVTMLGVFFFARLWKRTQIITDMEYVYTRYSGGSANVLRGFKASYLAIPYACIVMGWVNKAMSKIIGLTIPSFPRLGIIDTVLEKIYLATPLSKGVGESILESHVKVNESIKAGLIDPHQIYEKFHLSTSNLRLLKIYLQNAVDPEKIMAKFNLLGQLDSLKELVPSVDPMQILFSCGSFVTGVHELKILFGLFLVVIFYCTISGLWGVLITDFVQFWIAMAGVILLAVLAVNHPDVGGMTGLFTKMKELYTTETAVGMVSITPVKEAGALDLMPYYYFIIFVFLAWWAVGFTDGGSYFAQRMLSAKNEKHAALGYLWYGVAHYTLRMWPWLVVGMVAAVMFPYLKDPLTGAYLGADIAEDGYVKVMLTVLPSGLLGLLIVSFFAAYMSTISTQVNISASYLLNDLYRPFIKKGAPEKHYVRMSMVATLVIAFLGIVSSLFITTIEQGWFLLAMINSGIGVIYILRWYWWRINAWTEISCISTLVILAVLFKIFPDPIIPGIAKGYAYPTNLLLSVPVSFCIAMLVTFITKPVNREKLVDFYRRVQPGGPGWKPIQKLLGDDFKPRTPLTWTNLKGFLLSVATIYCFLFGFGKTIIGNTLYPEPLIGGTAMGLIYMIVGAGLLVYLLLQQNSDSSPTVRVIYLLLGLFLILWPLIKLVFKAVPLPELALYNSSFGILLICVGLFLGFQVAQTFTARRWQE